MSLLSSRDRCLCVGVDPGRDVYCMNQVVHRINKYQYSVYNYHLNVCIITKMFIIITRSISSRLKKILYNANNNLSCRK